MSAETSNNGSGGKQTWSQTIANDDGSRKLSLFEWTPESGRVTIYFSTPTDKLACGVRTRSLRHADRGAAVEWAQRMVGDPKVVLDEIEVAKPAKPKAEKSAEPTTKAADKGQKPMPKWPLKMSPDEYLEKYGAKAKNSELARQAIAAGGFTR